jgi:hypothetical protein
VLIRFETADPQIGGDALHDFRHMALAYRARNGSTFMAHVAAIR